MKTRFSRLMVAAAAAILVVGCYTGGAGSGSFSKDQAKEEIKIFITNVAFMDATVYGVVNGSKRRLGRVTGTRESVFTMPFRFPAEMYLEIDMLAGPKCRTERMTVDPGDHLELVIQMDSRYMTCGG